MFSASSSLPCRTRCRAILRELSECCQTLPAPCRAVSQKVRKLVVGQRRLATTTAGIRHPFLDDATVHPRGRGATEHGGLTVHAAPAKFRGVGPWPSRRGGLADESQRYRAGTRRRVQRSVLVWSGTELFRSQQLEVQYEGTLCNKQRPHRPRKPPGTRLWWSDGALQQVFGVSRFSSSSEGPLRAPIVLTTSGVGATRRTPRSHAGR